ncbi:MAG: hypothetical protein ACTSYM_07640 [Candidatus Baldrarchaeia archaeon]
MNPCLTFEFSEIVGAIYAVEMLSESHLVKTDIKYPIQVFSQELLEEYRRELSLSSFLWHLRPLLTATQDIDKSLSLYYRRQIVPLLEKAIKSYKSHWKKILPTLKQNIKYLVDLWENMAVIS